MSIKEMVKNNKMVFFQYYKTNKLWYKTEDGFLFPVPIADAGTAIFLAEDRAILFMRYIRNHMSFLQESESIDE